MVDPAGLDDGSSFHICESSFEDVEHSPEEDVPVRVDVGVEA